MNQPTELDRLIAAQKGETVDETAAAPAAPAPEAPAAPTAPETDNRKFWFVKDGTPTEAVASEIQVLVDEGYDGPVLDQNDPDQNWKKPADYGFTKAEAAPAVPTPPSTPEAPAAPATENLPATTGGSNGDDEKSFRALPTLVANEEEASKAMMALCGVVEGSDVSLGAMAESLESAGEMSHTFPFTQLKKDVWRIPDAVSSRNAEAGEFLPDGGRPWTGIFLGLRIGANGWIGAGKSGGGGNAPVWRFALPTARSKGVEMRQLGERVLKYGAKVQFTPGEKRVKFDGIGRMTPEVHILVWEPNVGFAILSASGYRATQGTLTAFKEIENTHSGKPIKFEIDSNDIDRSDKVSDPDKQKWTEYWVKGSADVGERGLGIAKAFHELLQRDQVSVANAVTAFHSASDFAGLSLDDVKDKLAEYDALLAGE